MGEQPETTAKAPFIPRVIARVKAHPVIASIVAVFSLLVAMASVPEAIDKIWAASKRAFPPLAEYALNQERKKLLCASVATDLAVECRPTETKWIDLPESGQRAVVMFGFAPDGQATLSHVYGYKGDVETFRGRFHHENSGGVLIREIDGRIYFLNYDQAGTASNLTVEVFVLTDTGLLKRLELFAVQPRGTKAGPRLTSIEVGGEKRYAERTRAYAVGGAHVESRSKSWVLGEGSEAYEVIPAPDRVLLLPLSDDDLYFGDKVDTLVIDADERLTFNGREVEVGEDGRQVITLSGRTLRVKSEVNWKTNGGEFKPTAVEFEPGRYHLFTSGSTDLDIVVR